MTDGKVHSRFGGSTASRWMNCAGSTALIATVPPAPSSSYADEGTLAHAFAEYFLREGERNAVQHVGATLDGKVDAIPLTQDMAAAIQMYLDAVWAEVDAAADSELHVEKGFSLDKAGEVFGTNDALVYTPSRKRLAVFDYKHGAGVSVYADNNAQLKFYAVGAAFSSQWPIREVELFIVQPRAFDVDRYGAVRPWKMDPADLVEFMSDIEAAVERANLIANDWPTNWPEDQEDLTVGEWCRWCPAATVCPAREQKFLQAAQLGFASIVDITKEELPAVDTIDTQRLADILAAADDLNAWVSQIRDRVESLLLVEGVAVPGWKVVEKIARAKWVEAEEKIAAHLALVYDMNEDDLRPRKLVTITEAERQLKAALPDAAARTTALQDMRVRFTIKETSGLTIAPASDRREAITPGPRNFGPVDLTA